MQYGVSRRLLNIERSLNFLSTKIPFNRPTNLDLQDSSAANVHINQLYINLYGTIDNILTVIAFETNFLDQAQAEDIEKAEKKFQKTTDIWNDHQNKKFINHLKSYAPEFTKFLMAQQAVRSSLINQLRHLSAHRIPLYIPNVIEVENLQVTFPIFFDSPFHRAPIPLFPAIHQGLKFLLKILDESLKMFDLVE